LTVSPAPFAGLASVTDRGGAFLVVVSSSGAGASACTARAPQTQG